MSQTGYFVGWSFVLFLLFFYLPLTRLLFDGNATLVLLWCLQLVCSQIVEYRADAAAGGVPSQSPSRLFFGDAALYCVDHIRGGAPPHSYAAEAHRQPLAGNRSESRWVITLREGESSASHVSKVDAEILCSNARGRMKRCLAFTGWIISQRYD